MTRLEQQIHRAIVVGLKIALPHAWIVRSDRGNPRSRVAGAIDKGLGSIKGWPDIEIIGRDEAGNASTWHIEVKAPGGRVRPEQHEVHDRIRDAGRFVGIARSLDDAFALGREWGWPLRITPNGRREVQ